MLHGLRIILADESAVTSGSFWGLGGQLFHLAVFFEECIEDNVEVKARPSGEESDLAHVGRSGAGPDEIRRVLRKPGRGRKLRVCGERKGLYWCRRVARPCRKQRFNRKSRNTSGAKDA